MMARNRDAGDDGQHPEQLMTVDQVAGCWQVHPRTVRRIIEKKKIAVVRIGRSVRIRRAVAEQGPEGTV
jgi:excisionase family DNA binding protein